MHLKTETRYVFHGKHSRCQQTIIKEMLFECILVTKYYKFVSHEKFNHFTSEDINKKSQHYTFEKKNFYTQNF